MTDDRTPHSPVQQEPSPPPGTSSPGTKDTDNLSSIKGVQKQGMLQRKQDADHRGKDVHMASKRRKGTKT